MMGKIKRPARPIVPSDMQIMAQAVADATRPKFASDHFAALRERELGRYGNYGMAHDPDTLRQKLSVGSMATSLTPDIHSSIAAQLQAMTPPKGPGAAATIGDLANKLSPTYTGSSSDGDPMSILKGPQFANPNLNVGDQTTSPTPAGASLPANPNPYVNDSGWSVTLSGLLASKAFTAAQLQSASIGNMNSLVKWIGGGGSTEFEHQQVLYMMQRYVLEGYLHGVDVPRLIQAQYHGSGLPIGFFADQGNTIGWGGGGQVTWSLSFWHGTDSAGQLADFYHELGHELLGEQHEANGIMHYIVESSSAIKANEAQLLTDYFRTHGGAGELGNGVSLAQFYSNPPATGSGVDPTPYLAGFPVGANFNPNQPPNAGPGPNGTPTTPNNITTNNTTVVAPTIQPQGLGSGGGDKGPEPSKPSDEKTLVAGSFGGAITALGGSGGGGADIGAALASLKSG